MSVQLRNTSAVAGAQVLQLYTHQRAGSSSRPVRELKSFQKVTLAPGEARTVDFAVPADELSFWSPALHRRVLEPGVFDVWVGSDSNAPLHSTFHVTGSGQ